MDIKIIEPCNIRIKKALSIRNMTQTELCSKAKISKSTLSEYLKGLYDPKQDKVFMLSQALNVDPVWLMGYDVPMEKKEASEDKKISPTELSEGEKVSAGQVVAKVGSTGSGLLFVIEDVDNLVVDTAIKGYDVGTVQTGMKVLIRSDATGNACDTACNATCNAAGNAHNACQQAFHTGEHIGNGIFRGLELLSYRGDGGQEGLGILVECPDLVFVVGGVFVDGILFLAGPILVGGDAGQKLHSGGDVGVGGVGRSYQITHQFGINGNQNRSSFLRMSRGCGWRHGSPDR